jgi:hypothetical protein
MAGATRLYHDLFTLPIDRAIYWLRLYRRASGRFAALVSEVPGNPGMSVTNGVSMIQKAIAAKFHIDEDLIDLVVIWPKMRWVGGPVERSSRSRVPADVDAEWSSLSWKRIESEVGAIPELPDHEKLFKRVLALGGRARETTAAVWEAVPVTSLPPPHHPFKCKYAERFDAMVGAAKSHKAHLAAGRRFLDSLTAEERAECRYHKADWAAIANASAEVVDELAGRTDADYRAAAGRRKLAAREKTWLIGLFAMPIDLSDGRDSYVNGQHRGCALRFSGAERAAAVVGAVTTQHGDADWTYLGEG